MQVNNEHLVWFEIMRSVPLSGLLYATIMNCFKTYFQKELKIKYLHMIENICITLDKL